MVADYKSTTHECPRCGDIHLPKPELEFDRDPAVHIGHRLGFKSDVYGTWCMDCHGWTDQ